MEWLINSKFLIIAITILILGIGRKLESLPYLHALTLYFSTVLHELSHYVVGKLLFLDIRGARFFPTIKKDLNGKIDIDAPHVSFNERAGQGLRIIPMAMAPISLFYVAIYIEDNWFTWFHPVNIFEYFALLFILIYLLVIFIYNAFPSWTDLSYLLAFPFSAIFWLILFVFIFTITYS